LSCVKCIKKSTKEFSLEDFKREFRIMQEFGDHPHIAHAHEIFQDQNSYYLVQDAYEGGDLASLNHNAKKAGVPMTKNWWRKVFTQSFQGLQYLHDHAIIHCDIKESNVMLKTRNYHSPELAIIDFGVSQAFGADRALMIGTPGYMPPEIWTERKWLPVGDIFSMGVVVLQMVTDNIPNHGKLKPGEKQRGIFAEDCYSVSDVAKATKHRDAPVQLIPQYLSGLSSLCSRLLDKKWMNRPTASQALDDPWFEEGNSRVFCDGPPGVRPQIPTKEARAPGAGYPTLVKCPMDAGAKDRTSDAGSKNRSFAVEKGRARACWPLAVAQAR
jgi:serine/threonine protein kinase